MDYGTPAQSFPIHYETHGGPGTTLLLVHGFGTNGSTWSHWVSSLAREYQVVVVDLKGFGASAKPRDEFYRPRDQADLLFKLVLRLDLKDLVLVGHSLGGGIVLMVASRLLEHCPERLRGLVLVAGTILPQPVPPFLRLAGRPYLGPLLMKLLPARPLVRKALRMAYRNEGTVGESLVEAYAQNLSTSEGRRALSTTARQLRPDDAAAFAERLPSIKMPVLLLWGQHDPVVPLWIGERSAELLPDAILQVLPDCGHMPQEERPGESLDLVIRFVQSIS